MPRLLLLPPTLGRLSLLDTAFAEWCLQSGSLYRALTVCYPAGELVGIELCKKQYHFFQSVWVTTKTTRVL